ncbi:MAG: CoB--CoM heterodisulfide reductase iron-sulfur subunit A family protein [Clostridiales bacterium]|nr:CoB--CoM heterodisulfide reductase iron-sulfur subunit A family protein [Clostridiales bacterium]HAW15352.1 disulfide reductase [Clostridiales bacterium]
MQRIGVFVCHCGTNIAATVDVKKVVELVRFEPGVVFADDYMYMCSEAGQEKIVEAIKEHELTGLVICSCSPRMHEKTFRACAEKAGLNPYMVEIANIREQCSWIHKDREEATKKAVILARAAIAKVNLNTPLKEGESPVTKRALVIGGGIAGIQTALDIADAGYQVDIVEKEPSIGGRMSQFDKTFPTLDCASCILTPKMVEVNQHPNITLYTYSEVEDVSGFVGNFDVQIRKKARSVDESACTGCGECQAKCPLGKMGKIPSEFDRGLRGRSAIYMPFAQAVPAVPVIDRENCTYFKTGKCGICAKICPSKAVNYEQQDEIVTVKYGAIVVATGFDIINLDKFGEYAYNESPDVITSIELERLMNASGPTGGHLERMSDHKQPKDIVFIQCVGSRCDDEEKGKPYCSKVCCMYTAKHAMLIKDHWPDTNVTVFYIDVRTPGKNFDEFYRRAVEQYHVNYIKGQVGKVLPQPDGSLVVQGVDLLDNKQIMKKTDMVVLAAAIEPNPGVRKIATMLTASIDNNNFLTEAHAKLRPVESPTAGIFLSGMAQGPKDIPETVSQAGAAAVKVVGLLAKDKLKTNPCTAKCDPMYCNGCSTCANVCPYGAITYEDQQVRGPGVNETRRVAVVNTALCQGCGACTSACPSGAMDLQGFSNRQITTEVDAICR